MSARGRGAKVEPLEFYATPPAAVDALLDAARLPGGRWLEPGAGDGAIIRAVNRTRSDVKWTAVEIQERFRKPLQRTGAELHRADFRRRNFGTARFRVAIGNPPFSLAAPFIQISLRLADEVIMLLRLNWLGSSRGRRYLFEAAGMPDVFPLAQRPAFTSEGTDACDYAWMRWYADGSQKGRMKILWGAK